MTWDIKTPLALKRALPELSSGRKRFTAVAKKIVVIGTGYVGLPLAIMLARSGYEVIGVDIEENIVNALIRVFCIWLRKTSSKSFRNPE